MQAPDGWHVAVQFGAPQRDYGVARGCGEPAGRDHDAEGDRSLRGPQARSEAMLPGQSN
jgi:hypothetical protein